MAVARSLNACVWMPTAARASTARDGFDVSVLSVGALVFTMSRSPQATSTRAIARVRICRFLKVIGSEPHGEGEEEAAARGICRHVEVVADGRGSQVGHFGIEARVLLPRGQVACS